MTDELKPVRCGCGGEAKVDANVSERTEPDRKFLEIVAKYSKFCTYPEYEEKPYYSIKYEENGEAFVGFGTYKPEVLSQYLREYFISSAEPERVAKVEKVDTNSPHSQVYKCCKCGQYTHRTAWSRDVVYCPSCGARLEWE